MKNSLSVALLLSGFLSGGALGKELYVSPSGLDSNSGTANAPFKTLAKAALTAQPGDNVWIEGGVYREILRPARSGQSGKPITFQAIEGEQVIISAMEAIDDWVHHEGGIYKAEVNWDLGQMNFVMQGATAMDLARWPNNIDGDPFTPDTLRNTGGSDGTSATDLVLRYDEGLPDVDWSNGGSIYFYGDSPGAGWLTWRAYIKSSDSTSVTFDLVKDHKWVRTVHSPDKLGDFFLQGVYGALDYENEWYYDASSRQLYVQLPKGEQPGKGLVQMRRRIKTIDLSGRDHIQIKNLAVFGGSIELTNGASHNLLYGITSLYGNHTLGVNPSFHGESRSVYLQGGTNNRIERSEIGYGAGTGIWDSANSTQVIDSYIHDFNYLGFYDAPLNSRGGAHSKYEYNTISKGGRDTIQAFNRFSEFAYNDVSHSNLIADDCALFYTVGGPQNIEVHHNWFHDAYSSGSKKKAAGIYLDNDSQAFEVHHNVVWNTEWSSIQINWDGNDLGIYNNTLWNGSRVMGAWHKEGTAFSNVRVWNNLSDDDQWEPQSDKQNNITVAKDIFTDFSSMNFMPISGSPTLRAGRVIAGVTDAELEQAPDVGAYQVGSKGPRWVPGIRWERKYGPTGWGCYDLPGEDCIERPTDIPELEVKVKKAVSEGETIELIATLSHAPASYPVIVEFDIGGSADTQDHNAQNGHLVFASGSGLQTKLPITIHSDEKVEPDEQIELSIKSITNALYQGQSIEILINGETTATEKEPPQEPASPQGGGAMWLLLGWVLLLLGKGGLNHRYHQSRPHLG